MSVVRAVLFDFNGTLSDDEPIMCGIYEAMFAEHGRPMTAAEYYGQLAVPPAARHVRVEITDPAGRKAWANPIAV